MGRGGKAQWEQGWWPQGEVCKHYFSLTTKLAHFPSVFTLMAFVVSSGCSGGIPTSLSLGSC